MNKIKINYEMNGGNIPTILSEKSLRKQIFPIVYSDNNIYHKNNIIVNNQSSNSYNLTDSFIFEELNGIGDTNISTNKLSYLVNENIIINDSNIIPFHACLIDNKFDIITKFFKLITSKYIDQSIISNNDKKFVSDIFKKYFILHRDTLQFIGLSAKFNILNKIIFANKLKDFLNLIYTISDNSSNEFNKEQIKELYLNMFGTTETKEQIFINLSDLSHLFKEYTDIQNIKIVQNHKINLSKEEIDCEIDKLTNYYSNFTDTNVKSLDDYFTMDYTEILDLIKFNKILNKIDALITPFNIKLSHLFYAGIIGYRLYHPSLSIGYLSPKLFPINISSFIENLIGHPINLTINSVSNLEEKLYNLSSILPNYHTYGQSTFIDNDSKEYNFPDCVENTLLQLIKTLCWLPDEKKFDSNLLPTTTISSLKTFMDSLNDTNDNTKNIKNNFTSIISNIDELKTIYKNNDKYEIKSDLDNVVKLLFYLFGLAASENTNYDKLIKSLKAKEEKDKDRKKDCDDDEEKDKNKKEKKEKKEKRKYKNTIINKIFIENRTINIITTADTSIIFSFNSGHASHYISSNIRTLFNNYIFRDLIVSLTSNYSFITSINFNLYTYISQMYSPINTVNLYININELLLDSNLYFIDIIKNGDFNTIDLFDIIQNTPNIIKYINLLEPNDQLKLYYNSSLIHNFINELVGNVIRSKIHNLQLYKIIIELINDDNILMYNYYLSSESEDKSITVSRNLIYYIMYSFYSFCTNNSYINMNDELIYCNLINKIIDPLMKRINKPSTLKKIFHTKTQSKANSNTLYDLIAILPNNYQNYFCNFLNKEAIKTIPITKFILDTYM